MGHVIKSQMHGLRDCAAKIRLKLRAHQLPYSKAGWFIAARLVRLRTKDMGSRRPGLTIVALACKGVSCLPTCLGWP